ncbi:MAG: putative CRISPR-associated protein [Chloroflexota bacterium]|nr:putative CRISPR-associated protein [Chloroflexota bacterium]
MIVERQKQLVLSPVGISLFFNSLESDEKDLRREINQHSNDVELPSELAAQAGELAQRAAEKLHTGSVSERRRLSAELNGLYALYENHLEASADMHLLVATDTALGKKAAETIENFLREDIGIKNIDTFVPSKLSTGSVANFSYGIKELLNHFEKIIPPYSAQEYKIIFNLTGGFKSLQGYLNIIGMFYADRLVYIFERSDELLNIPRLPLKIDEAKLNPYANELARLAAGGVYLRSELHITGALLDVDGNKDATLSDWGQLLWNRLKDPLLAEKLLELPYIEYENSFKKDWKKFKDKSLRIKLQETVCQASVMLEEAKGDITALKRSGGMLYDNYEEKRLPSGLPIGHFRIDDGNRVTCTYQGNKLSLRHFGSHDYTERAEGVR